MARGTCPKGTLTLSKNEHEQWRVWTYTGGLLGALTSDEWPSMSGYLTLQKLRHFGEGLFPCSASHDQNLLVLSAFSPNFNNYANALVMEAHQFQEIKLPMTKLSDMLTPCALIRSIGRLTQFPSFRNPKYRGGSDE